MSETQGNRYRALHNAMWPGLVGKGPDSEPSIDLDTMRWVPGLQIGYEHTFIHQAADFLAAASLGRSAPPAFRDAMQTDYVTDAVLQSAAGRNRVKVKNADTAHA